MRGGERESDGREGGALKLKEEREKNLERMFKKKKNGGMEDWADRLKKKKKKKKNSYADLALFL